METYTVQLKVFFRDGTTEDVVQKDNKFQGDAFSVLTFSRKEKDIDYFRVTVVPQDKK